MVGDVSNICTFAAIVLCKCRCNRNKAKANWDNEDGGLG